MEEEWVFDPDRKFFDPEIGFYITTTSYVDLFPLYDTLLIEGNNYKKFYMNKEEDIKNKKEKLKQSVYYSNLEWTQHDEDSASGNIAILCPLKLTSYNESLQYMTEFNHILNSNLKRIKNFLVTDSKSFCSFSAHTQIIEQTAHYYYTVELNSELLALFSVLKLKNMSIVTAS